MTSITTYQRFFEAPILVHQECATLLLHHRAFQHANLIALIPPYVKLLKIFFLDISVI